MKLQFLKLSDQQMKQFGDMKSSTELQFHGPLQEGQEVPVHTHNKAALYKVEGLAAFNNGANTDKVLGDSQEVNAVLVPAEQLHGWLGLKSNTIIEHVFGSGDIQKVLA